MLVTTTAEMVRMMGAMVRRADATLAYGAARNAASSMRDHRAQRLDDLRTLHDLQRLARGPAPYAVAGVAPSAGPDDVAEDFA